MNYEAIVIHYAEVATKGKNRPLFERMLTENILAALKEEKHKGIKKYYGRLILYLAEASNLDAVLAKLQKVCGISSVSPAITASNTSIEDIKAAAERIVSQNKTLKVRCKRSFKKFPLSSPDICKEVGHHLQQKFNMTIDLVEPEERLYIEITEGKSFLYTKKLHGVGGLPVGVSGKVIVMLSGGIDSPVAAYLIMKRGCKPVYIHFHSHPYTSTESITKAKQLFEALLPYTPSAKLYLVPFIEIQKKIMMSADKDYRVILYRRYMLRIAEQIARKENAQAIVTGDNLAQVASQTLSNLHTVSAATSLTILRPLLTFDKQEIINVAKQIGTYELSIQPHEDCCSLFVPKHPATSSRVKDVEEIEARMGDLSPVLAEALKSAESTSTHEDTPKE